MSDVEEPSPTDPGKQSDASMQAALAALAASQPFGPAFFLSHLRALVRDHCPTPGELPRLDLHLGNGEVLPVCHIVGVAPTWVALAVPDPARSEAMRLEMIPFAAIARVTLGAVVGSEREIGFESERHPLVVTAAPESAEELLEKAAGADASGASPSS